LEENHASVYSDTFEAIIAFRYECGAVPRPEVLNGANSVMYLN